jgi:hypothetical protein
MKINKSAECPKKYVTSRSSLRTSIKVVINRYNLAILFVLSTDIIICISFKLTAAINRSEAKSLYVCYMQIWS